VSDTFFIMNDYSIRELECFVAVAEELSFTRAAKRLHLAQPPLSRHIQALESRLGTRLFDRSTRGVSITAAGRAFLQDTRSGLTQLQRAGASAKRAARGETGRLEIGFTSAVYSPELVQIFRSFRKKYPQVQMILHDDLPSDQLRWVAEGRIDGGFVGTAPQKGNAELSFIPWHKEPLLLFVPPDHHLAKSRQVSFRRLREESFVAIASEASPAFSAQFHQLCRSAGFRPRIIQEAERAQAVAVMVAAGAGIAVLPAALTRVVGDALVALKLTEKAASLSHMFAHRKGDPSGPLGDFLKGLLTLSS
jgi:DNA-binding transcriptional LysR family regulator